MTKPLDWRLVQSLLAVAETGSLSAAAERLGLSQPTLGRQVAQIEAALGVRVFARHPRGYALTPEGEALLPAARSMADGAAALALAAGGRAADLAGTVRITASMMVATHWLPPVIARLRDSLPEVQIEIAPTDRTENLLYREADIAIRMVEPVQLDIVRRRLGDVSLGFFARKSYLDRHGRPAGIEDLLAHGVLGFDRSDLLLAGLRAGGLAVTREDFPVRTDDQVTYWQMVRAGCGIGVGQVPLARALPELEQVLPGLPLPHLPVWLAAPEALRQTPRVRRVWDHLATALRPWLDAPA